jgi:serine/threonine-protein kinase
MATVWAADDQVLGRQVAVKVLAPQIGSDPDARVRFEREARTAARVSDHGNVVTIYDVGEHDGNAFIVMEYLAGGTVAEQLRGDHPVPRSQALGWLEDAAAALDAAHAAGIVHRDVKPANLLLDERGRLAVADFGIARLATDIGLTSTGQVLGTAAYLSPEQALGRPATSASDRYALAVVAYELLTGERPFAGEHAAAQARQHVEAQPPRATTAAPDLPLEVDRVLARGLAKEPDERWPSAAAFVGALREAVDGTTARTRVVPVTAPTAALGRSELIRPKRAARPRRRVPAWAGLIVALAVGGVVLGLLLASGDDGGKAVTGRTAPAKARTTKQPQTTAPAQSNAATLNAQGKALLDRGSYAQAIEVLNRAVQAGRSTPCANPPSRACLDNFAYPLFNLAQAYRLSGQPAQAIPLLNERLQIDDQREAVERELAAAQQALTGPAKGKGKAKAKKPNKG